MDYDVLQAFARLLRKFWVEPDAAGGQGWLVSNFTGATVAAASRIVYHRNDPVPSGWSRCNDSIRLLS